MTRRKHYLPHFVPVGDASEPGRRYHVETQQLGSNTMHLALRLQCHYNAQWRQVVLTVDLRDDADDAIHNPQHTWRTIAVIKPPAPEPGLDHLHDADLRRVQMGRAVMQLAHDFLEHVTDADLETLGWLSRKESMADARPRLPLGELLGIVRRLVDRAQS